ncbi:putative histone-lysine n-methyltransferase [Phaeomoniella chlamydospora]|uniref:Putative histone-lysine n-methyltransferase n=1 Tax=Phaeomoniella chlamydospora TaxID=158046 RepID=A0A0G2DZD6_PHACM|nr:putative histone-lysine n-methyltransferase [Phaeomoniella chlamydospora]
MPFTQTTLKFSNPVPSVSSQETKAVTRPGLSRLSTASSETLPFDEDTIVVAGKGVNHQLPTPDDSATDASSQSSETINLKKEYRGQIIRVGRVGSVTDRKIEMGGAADDLQSGLRNVSGKTLVPSGSESSLLRTGIDALDMDWALSRTDLILQDENNESMDSLDTINVVDRIENGAELKQPSAKELKEKAEIERQARYKAADDRATRRSSRVSMLERAGTIVSDLAISASTLGKRSHAAMERSKDRLGSLKRTGSLRRRSAFIEGSTVAPSFEGPTTKKRRLSDPALGRAASDPAVSIAAEKLTTNDTEVTGPHPYKAKKYLASGLYAGQTRDMFIQRPSKTNRRTSAGMKENSEQPLSQENKILPLPMFACERLWNIGTDFRLPFDVFCPLPSSQPKPDEWRKLNKNTFVGDAAAYWRGNDTLLKQFQSLCGCSESTGCDEDCQNRIMFYECNDSNCSLGKKHCGNRNFADLKERVKKGGKYQIGVEVIKTADRGYGVRSNRTFRPNQIIVEYSGEIITQEECEHRMRTTYKDNSHYYLMLFDSALVIDATARGSIARFVNHSCERGIMTGQELTYDYNFDPFCARNVQECRCGSIGCRGILGKRGPEKKSGEKKSDPKEKEAAKDKRGGILAGAKRKLQLVLDESTSAMNLTAKSKKQKRAGKSLTPVKSKTNGKVAKKVAGSPAKRNVSFASTKTSPVRRKGQLGKPRNAAGPNNTPVASRAVSFSSVKKSASTPALSSARKKIKSRIQTPGMKGSGSMSNLKGLLGRSNSKSKAKTAVVS